MMGLWITLIVIAGILLLFLITLPFVPIRARLIVNQDEISLTVSALFFRKKLLSVWEQPKKLKDVAKSPTSPHSIRKEDRRRRKLEKKLQKKRRQKWLKAQERRLSPKLTLSERLDLVEKILKVTGQVTRGRVTLQFDRMHVRIATGDAASTAILYGAVLQTTAYLMQWIQTEFAAIERKPGAMTVETDYTAKSSSLDVDLTAKTIVCKAVPGLFRLRSAYRREKSNARVLARERRQKKSSAA